MERGRGKGEVLRRFPYTITSNLVTGEICEAKISRNLKRGSDHHIDLFDNQKM